MQKYLNGNYYLTYDACNYEITICKRVRFFKYRLSCNILRKPQIYWILFHETSDKNDKVHYLIITRFISEFNEHYTGWDRSHEGALKIYNSLIIYLWYAAMKRRICASSLQFQSTLIRERRFSKRRKLCKHIRILFARKLGNPNKLYQELLLNGASGLSQGTCLVGTGTLSLPSSIIAFELLHYAGQSWLQLPSSHPLCQLFNYTYSSPSNAVYSIFPLLIVAMFFRIKN